MTTTFSIAQFRQYFPAIQDITIFLDSAATALKPNNLISATVNCYQPINISVHRDQHPTA
ncbi:aminotransferase class V-fold PLP-dependent enzyme [Arsenophonus nasoniae]|nr:aminotransferase class V-fold PLP-dependent enzyme [Arsenophonus nasoniae]WGM02017.1 aminotransferase class V-fold PLP-dependent enzyme [Arsenophonus nasoniae]WGM06248.1 aminotransferase class V-fold PLP-dependent enzyme [Arsenophonus nasoniae]WGM11184.1 aminotransferase class V-fold PLP-dependent enzyme [Arsenophonus nasoniae]WGM15883.1 aminotransferase class V-fold PLP-dependent enzyme [Arsenophonus nasoniae]